MTNRVSHAAGLRRGLMACCALLVLGAAAPALAQELAAPPVAFTLPTQPLDLALPAFAKQADVQVLYASNLVKGKRANAVIGTRPPAEALRDLLAGSGLKATATGPRTFLISVQENPVVAELEEVIVTAQKRSARIENVPIAVTVVEGGDAQRRGITNVVDLVDQVAGVSVNYAFGGTNYGLISIRGIGGADDYKPNGNPSVALHVDGVYQTSNAYLGMPLFDLDRIEVLKGPQGTLYGRNTTAGVINAITRVLVRLSKARAASSTAATTTRRWKLRSAGPSARPSACVWPSWLRMAAASWMAPVRAFWPASVRRCAAWSRPRCRRWLIRADERASATRTWSPAARRLSSRWPRRAIWS